MVENGYTYPVVHLAPESSWLPELRTLILRGNALNATVYVTLQTVVALKSLQTLDMGKNALTGSVEDVLTLFYCNTDASAGGNSSACDEEATGTAGPLLRIVALDSNDLTGALRRQASFVRQLS